MATTRKPAAGAKPATAQKAAAVKKPAAAAPTGPVDGRPPREVPVRELLPNEVLGNGRFAPVVIRTDKRNQVQEQSGWFTTQDRETLRQCRELLERIVKA